MWSDDDEKIKKLIETYFKCSLSKSLEIFEDEEGSDTNKILCQSLAVTILFCSIFLICFKDCIFGTKNGLKYDDHTCIALCEPVCITMEKEMYVLKNL